MRKIFVMSFILTSLILLNGCSIKKEEYASDYFPIKTNIEYSYEGLGNEFASYKTHIDYTSKTKIQTHTDNGGTSIIKVYEITNDKITLLFSRPESYYRYNYLSKNEGSEIILKTPIKVGTTWVLSDGSIRTITNINTNIETDLGSYKTIEVTTENDGNKTKDYYAKGVGLIKTIYVIGEDTISSTLNNIDKNKSETQNINLYYPSLNDNKLYYKEITIKLHTNDDVLKLIENNYQDNLNDIKAVFSKNTKINNLYFKNDIVYIDLNKAFITDMNAGSEYESMILQSVTNTFGQYFNTEKVVITIDNSLYESGHIALKEGEYFTVNYNNAEKAE